MTYPSGAEDGSGLSGPTLPPAYENRQDTGPVVSGPGPTNWVNTTTPLNIAPGRYQVDFTGTVQIAQIGASAAFTVTVAGNGIGQPIVSTGAADTNNERREVTKSDTFTHAGGPMTVVVQLRRDAGAGNVTGQHLLLTIRKIR